ncbi:NifB/NifX family molybdenum-iron cluster-binding protein [Desulfotomaculum varum]
MKIAIPARNGQVNEHFGTTREFAVIELENGKVKHTKLISNEGLQHNHGGIANMLKNEKIDAIICGGIGGHMIQALQQLGLKVVTGAAGPVEKVAEAYAAGTLVTRPVQCGCGGGHHHHHHGGGCHH